MESQYIYFLTLLVKELFGLCHNYALLCSNHLNYNTGIILNLLVTFQQHPIVFFRLLPQYFNRWIRLLYDAL